MHGGLILSLTDTMGSLAVATKGKYLTGVSVDIGTSFVLPAGRLGDILCAKATLTGMGTTTFVISENRPFYRVLGKFLAYTRVEFTNPNGELVAYGRKLNIHFVRAIDNQVGPQTTQNI